MLLPNNYTSLCSVRQQHLALFSVEASGLTSLNPRCGDTLDKHFLCKQEQDQNRQDRHRRHRHQRSEVRTIQPLEEANRDRQRVHI